MTLLFRIVRIDGAGYNAESRDVRSSLSLEAAERALIELQKQHPNAVFRIAGD